MGKTPKDKIIEDLEIKPAIDPATRHGLTVVFLFAVALILVLAFLGKAGFLGDQLESLLRLIFGWVALGVPVVFMIIGWYLLQPTASFELPKNIGGVLLTLGITGLFHFIRPIASWSTLASVGEGGGYLGFWISKFLVNALGYGGGLVILVALVISGLLLLFQTSLKNLFGVYKKILIKLPRRNASFDSTLTASEPAATPQLESESNTLTPLKKIFQNRSLSGTGKQATLLEVKSVRIRKIQIPIELLEVRGGKPSAGDIEASKLKIQHTLQNFGIEVTMGKVNVGPTVTQYTLAPSEGVKLSSITTLSNDLALALAAHPIRIEAPIPGQSLVGIEVPNQTVATVGLRDILESETFKQRTSNLTGAIGKDVAGLPFVADIAKMPHLLIAGATGSGKSVCINSIIISLLYTNSPDEMKLIMVDPKRVELASYNDIPHLLTPVITEVNKTINALKWVVGEMDRRYHVLSGVAKRNLQSYNQAYPDQAMPYILVIIDELADLMAVSASEVEAAIIRLAQMARAVGIHLIVATQRPSVDVITGLIKANITSRVAFAVASGTDSRTILDTSGAEKLLGRGDSLFISAELSKPKRLQAAFISDVEIERVVSYLREQAKPDYNLDVTNKPAQSLVSGMGNEDSDALYNEAKITVVRAGKASASLLQRRLRVGYARAARLLDLLEEEGIIGPADGARPRDILVERDDLVQDFATLPGEEEVVDNNQEISHNVEGGAEVEEGVGEVVEEDK